MAESIVSILVQHLQILIAEGNKLFAGLADDIEFVKRELEHMIAFLSFADAEEDNDPDIAVWVNQVRDVVYDTEDVVDECDLLFSSHYAYGCLWKIYTIAKSLRARPRLASELQRIKSNVHNISEGHKRYRDRRQIQTQTFGPRVASYTEVSGRGAALLQDDADLVGMEKPKDDLKTLLLHGDSQFKVISVVGMPGIGKTTLVKKVYEDVRSQFESHAWVTVSKLPDIKELLKNLIEQLFDEIKEEVPRRVQSMNVDDLKAFIKDLLEETRYIIVFDDIWERPTWEDLQYVLPKTGSKCRVLLTTRCKEVAENVYEMKALSLEDSRTLFCRRVFKDVNCPEYLKDILERTLRKCGGSPYIILAIARVFALKNKTLEDWQMLYHSIPLELEVYGKLDGVRRLLLLSFYQLPHRLKFCLLYLSIFPGYKKMNWMQVIRLWIAEGLLDENERLTREEVGNDYLQELVNRNLLRVVQKRLDGRPIACAVDGILREIIVSKSKKENILTIAGEKGIRINWPNKVRRLAIHGPLEDTEDTSKFKQLRSLVLFSSEDLPPKPLLSKMICDGSRLLKVLDLRGAQLETIPEEVFKLYLLEYLCLRRTKVRIVPKSIGKLRNLETLDLKETFVTELPVQILKLRRLRHLIAYRYEDVSVHDGVQSFRAPYKIGSLVALQKLSYMEVDERRGVRLVTEIGKLAGLRKLGITKLRREDGKDLCSSLERLTNLRSLYVVSREADEIIDLPTLRSGPPFLRTLTLRGRLEKIPQWISSLHDLTKVALLESRLEDEPLQYLEDLPHLVELCLFRFYEGEEMHFKARKFPCVKKLILASLNGLRRIRIEKSSMPFLTELIIVDSKLMDELPYGIEHLSNLQYVQLVDMAPKLITSLKNEECRRTQAKIYVGIWEDIKTVRKLQNVRFKEVAKKKDRFV